MKPRARRRPRRWGFARWALLPGALILAAFTVVPLWKLIQLSLSTLQLSQGGFVSTYVGLANFTSLTSDSHFVVALRNSFVFLAVSTPIELGIGLWLAVVVHQRPAGLLRTIFNSAILLPILVSPIAVSVNALLLLDLNVGFLNVALHAFGLPSQNWLAGGTSAMGAVIGVDVWQWTPFIYLIVMAGLSGIPDELLEAAAADGASGRRAFWHIQLPLLRPALVLAFIFKMIFGLKLFDNVYLLTHGGPGFSTEVLNTYAFREFFEDTNNGYAAAISVVMILIAMMAGLAAFLMTRRSSTT